MYYRDIIINQLSSLHTTSSSSSSTTSKQPNPIPYIPIAMS